MLTNIELQSFSRRQENKVWKEQRNTKFRYFNFDFTVSLLLPRWF